MIPGRVCQFMKGNPCETGRRFIFVCHNLRWRMEALFFRFKIIWWGTSPDIISKFCVPKQLRFSLTIKIGCLYMSSLHFISFFSIISIDCWAGCVFENLHLPIVDSPVNETIGFSLTLCCFSVTHAHHWSSAKFVFVFR